MVTLKNVSEHSQTLILEMSAGGININVKNDHVTVNQAKILIKLACCGSKQNRGKISTSSPTRWLVLFLLYASLSIKWPTQVLSVFVPKELSHREAPFPQHRAEQLGQVQPDVGNVDGHVVRLLQRVCKPEKTTRQTGHNLK